MIFKVQHQGLKKIFEKGINWGQQTPTSTSFFGMKKERIFSDGDFTKWPTGRRNNNKEVKMTVEHAIVHLRKETVARAPWQKHETLFWVERIPSPLTFTRIRDNSPTEKTNA